MFKKGKEKTEPYRDEESHPKDAGDQQSQFHFHFIWKESPNSKTEASPETLETR